MNRSLRTRDNRASFCISVWMLFLSKIIAVCFVLPIFFVGCRSELDPSKENVEYYYTGKPAQPPPGVVRYCWEEPIVDYEPQGPGLRDEGKWYYPSAVVARQVRGGRWRPCEAKPDELKGETRNERE